MVLGLMIPILLAYSVVTRLTRRWISAGFVIGVGVLTTSLSGGLTFGATHALGWFTVHAQVALGLSLVLSLALAWLSRPLVLAFLLLGLTIHLMVLNQGASDVYWAHNLQTWQQGQYIRFNGVAQWMGWLWPFGVLIWVFTRWSSSQRSR